eukprot:TCONS_00019845-protein
MLVYIREGLASRKLKIYSSKGIQIIIFELRLKKNSWLILAIYKNPKIKIKQFIEKLSDLMNEFLGRFDRLLVLGDFNTEPSQTDLKQFMDRYNLSNLIQQKTCFKKPEGTCIDLILTNCKSSLQHSHAVETDLSDFHLMPITMFREGYESLPPQTIQYRDFSKFKGFDFNLEL